MILTHVLFLLEFMKYSILPPHTPVICAAARNAARKELPAVNQQVGRHEGAVGVPPHGHARGVRDAHTDHVRHGGTCGGRELRGGVGSRFDRDFVFFS